MFRLATSLEIRTSNVQPRFCSTSCSFC